MGSRGPSLLPIGDLQPNPSKFVMYTFTIISTYKPAVYRLGNDSIAETEKISEKGDIMQGDIV